MKKLRKLSLATAMLCIANCITFLPAYALTKQKVEVIGIPIDAARINNTNCIAPMVCTSKKSGKTTYDPGVWGTPKFRPGEVTLRDGTKLKGSVALLNLQRDWNFVKQFVLVIPEGEQDAIFLGRKDALLIKQETKKGLDVYDRYAGAYLRRRVSGPMRLSYNPAAGTSRSISKFIPASIIANLSGAAGKEAVIGALRDGKTVGESLAAGKNVGSVVGEVLASIEITEKEYLLYDEQADRTTAITKGNYRSVITDLFSDCQAADTKILKSFMKKYKKIDEAVAYHNTTCS